MSYRIYLSPPDVGELEQEYVMAALRSGWVAPRGPHVDAFESEIAEFVGVDHAVALSSGTAGLHLGLLALGVNPGDEVVVPTMTFAATAFAVTYVGAKPVFIDSEPRSLNMDPDLLRELLRQRADQGKLPAAVVVVDIFGQTADYERLEATCAEFGVPLLEDAAEALGAVHSLGNAGTFGRAAVFSFNGNKIMTTSGGGMFVTNDIELAGRVRYLATQAREPVTHYEHRSIGFNYRLSNVLAAIGRAQLQRLPEMIERRRATRSTYHEAFGPPSAEVLRDAPWGAGNAWLSLLRMELPDDANQVRSALAAVDIESRPVWKPMHRQPVFAECHRVDAGVADDFFARSICLPSGSALTLGEIDEVVSVVRSVGTAYE